MSWTTSADLRLQVQKLWDRGMLLSSLAEGKELFPGRLTLKKPTSRELSEQFTQVRAWIVDLLQGTHYRVVMREVRHNILGSNSVPDEIWMDSLDDALALINKNREAGRFKKIVAMIQGRRPLILSWLTGHPLKALALADDWQLLIDIIDWIEANPCPGIYLRQIDLPGVHTKFIETHRAVLMELLELSLLPAAVDTSASGVSRFCRRYGFLDKPLRIRFRVLDPELALLPASTDQDIAVNQDTFNCLDLKVSHVFITENEINFLAFPNLPRSLVIFGAGYGFEMLAQAAWLKCCEIYYWGDIDTHGFAILDQLRADMSHVKSFLMDRETLTAHKQLWGHEPQPVIRDLSRLTAEERALYDELRDNRTGTAIRLEQERIGYGWVKTALDRLFQKPQLKPKSQ
jgi:hypothetical protein